MDKMPCNDEILAPAAVAKYFGVTTRTIRNWVRAHALLPPLVMGRRKYWLRTALQAWLAGRGQQKTSFPVIAPKTPVRRVGRPRLPT
jgi:transposase